MIVFFTSTLVISILGLVSLLTLKRWEMTTGHVLGGQMRPKVGVFAHRALGWFEQALPALARRWGSEAVLFVRAFLHRLAALGVVVIERVLERLLKLLRRKTAVPRNDENASAFLREVSAHKAQLLRSARKGAIYEE